MGGGALAVKMTTGVPVSSSGLGMERRGEEEYMMQRQRCRADKGRRLRENISSRSKSESLRRITLWRDQGKPCKA
jgi:hypothetical protein